MADVGSYMSISSENVNLYKDLKGPEMQANHNKPTNTQTSQTTCKSSSQTCISSRETTNQTHKRGSGLTTASLSKTCKNELRTTTFKNTACPLWRRCAEAVHEHGSANVPLSASSQINLYRRPPWTGSPSSFSEQECRGHCTRYL